MTLAEHLRLVDEHRSVETAKQVLGVMQEFPFVLVGGWAVYAHGSAVPSVDFDIWYHSDDHVAIANRFIEQTGIQIDAEAGCRRLNLDWEFSDTDNKLFGGAGVFRRGELAWERRDLLGYEVPVLTGPDLLFSKAKAFHDRSRQWALSRDPTRLAALGLRDPEEAAWVRSRDEAYWFRKAGKDLADVRFLQRHYEMGGPEPLQTVVEAALDDPAPELVAWGTR